MNFDLNEILQHTPELIIAYAVKILLTIAVFFIGKWLASTIAGVLQRTMMSRSIDPTVSQFTRNIVYYILLTVVIIAALGQLGVQTASFVAIIGAAGLAIGFALQGSLANFAAGVLLISFRPFKKGDYIEAAGTAGVVEEISIFSTILLTPDNKTVVVANASVMSDTITNYSAQPTRRVDMTIGVSYNADLSQVKRELKLLVDNDSRILKEPEVTIAVAELASSSVNLVLRPWVNTPDYWNVYFDLTEKVKIRFDEVGIEIPFDQLDLHVNYQPESAK